tara:strand:- start:1796 stop:3097 length:1302 start_codon:yes stop_codon:yes gene_type:complete
MNVCVVGLGYVGLTLALTLADLGIKVSGIDTNKDTTKKLNQSIATISEKGLEELLKKNLNKNFQILENFENKEFEIFIICVGTPLNENKKPILEYIVSATNEIGTVLKKGQTIILRSTVPVGTTKNTIIPILENNSGLKAGKDFEVSFAPERTAEGVALSELRKNPQIIGSLTEKGFKKTEQLFLKMTKTILPVSNIETAEMMKLIDNSYRDVHFAYSNEIALICEMLKIDARECIEKANFEYPRNQIAMPSPGVGGPCLSKDPYILVNIANTFDYDPKLISHSRWVNENVPVFLSSKIIKKLEKLDKKSEKIKIFVIGFAFKGNPETDDIRESSTIVLVNELKKKFTNIQGYDPVVSKKQIEDLGVRYTEFEEGFIDSDCIIIMNNNKSYFSHNIENLMKKTNKPCIFVDTWSMFKEFMGKENIIYTSVGLE